KKLAMADLFGDWDVSYKLLPECMAAVEASNLGSVVIWHTSELVILGVMVFQQVFWAFGAVIEAFTNCRPVISVDGTHLYWKYKGKLFIAVDIVKNGQLLQLAFAITE
ncbi:hypothetical protein CFOL_v3_01648, partial [Cephalotus follicularis]